MGNLAKLFEWKDFLVPSLGTRGIIEMAAAERGKKSMSGRTVVITFLVSRVKSPREHNYAV
jgi:hypothetical protein